MDIESEDDAEEQNGEMESEGLVAGVEQRSEDGLAAGLKSEDEVEAEHEALEDEDEDAEGEQEEMHDVVVVDVRVGIAGHDERGRVDGVEGDSGEEGWSWTLRLKFESSGRNSSSLFMS